MSTAISIVKMSVIFDNNSVVNDVSANIKKGHITGLIGPSGAGKTTLIRGIVGLQAFHSGNIDIFGLPAGHAKLRLNIGYMSQSPAVYSDLTALQNMQYFAVMRGGTGNEITQILEMVDLSPQAKQLASTLSGGQLSRLSLAIALLGSPSLLVLDEPTIGVDPLLRQQLWKIFRQLARQGTTIIISSHSMDEASLCDSLLLMRGGKVIAQDTPSNLVKTTKTDSVESAFLKLAGGIIDEL